MQPKRSIVLLLIFISVMGFSQNKVVYLQNEFIKAGFLPDVGGRMVFIAPLGQDNFLLSDEKFWNEDQSKRIAPKPESMFKPYNGFITWVGPQKEWWIHQEFMAAKKAKADVWPPDPYLIYGDFKIVEQTEQLLVLEGPESPITGVQLYKKYELKGSSLEIEVTAKNIRNENISWDLWSNGRFDAYTKFKIATHEENVRIEAREDGFQEIVGHKVENNVFTFLPEPPAGERKQRVSKAFIYPDEAEIDVLKGDWNLKIQFDKVPKELIHPDQALIEVYNCITQSGRNNVLELEHHAAYKTLEPNQKMSMKEVWTFGKL